MASGRQFIGSTFLFLALVLALGVESPCQYDSPSSTAAAAKTRVIDFDVVSIRQSKNPAAPMSHLFPANGDSMSFTNTPLALSIFYVYNGDHAGVTKGLPAWVQTERYDITAKVTGSNVEAYSRLNQNERKQMLQRVLEDRFKLRAHHESRITPVYDLVLASGGSKLAAAQPSDMPANGRTVFYTGAGQLSGHGARVADLAAALSDTSSGRSDSALGRQVIDKTGLGGRYNFTLRFAFDPGSVSPPGSDVPSIFSAIQEQLGLKLVPSTSPVDMLVIDHIERPTEN